MKGKNICQIRLICYTVYGLIKIYTFDSLMVLPTLALLWVICTCMCFHLHLYIIFTAIIEILYLSKNYQCTRAYTLYFPFYFSIFIYISMDACNFLILHNFTWSLKLHKRLSHWQQNEKLIVTLKLHSSCYYKWHLYFCKIKYHIFFVVHLWLVLSCITPKSRFTHHRHEFLFHFFPTKAHPCY